jgi:hypothetical protein
MRDGLDHPPLKVRFAPGLRQPFVQSSRSLGLDRFPGPGVDPLGSNTAEGRKVLAQSLFLAQRRFSGEQVVALALGSGKTHSIGFGSHGGGWERVDRLSHLVKPKDGVLGHRGQVGVGPVCETVGQAIRQALGRLGDGQTLRLKLDGWAAHALDLLVDGRDLGL